MRNGKNSGLRLTSLRIEYTLNIQRNSLGPGCKTRACQNIIEHHGKTHTLRLAIKSIQRKNPHFVKGRIDDMANEIFQGKILPFSPEMQEKRTEQNMFTTLQRITLYIN